MSKYKEYKTLNLPQVADEILEFWEKEGNDLLWHTEVQKEFKGTA